MHFFSDALKYLQFQNLGMNHGVYQTAFSQVAGYKRFYTKLY